MRHFLVTRSRARDNLRVIKRENKKCKGIKKKMSCHPGRSNCRSSMIITSFYGIRIFAKRHSFDIGDLVRFAKSNYIHTCNLSMEVFAYYLDISNASHTLQYDTNKINRAIPFVAIILLGFLRISSIADKYFKMNRVKQKICIISEIKRQLNFTLLLPIILLL